MFLQGGVCVHIRQWRFQRILHKTKSIEVINYEDDDGKTWGFY